MVFSYVFFFFSFNASTPYMLQCSLINFKLCFAQFLLSKIWQILNLIRRAMVARQLVPRTIYAPVLLKCICERFSKYVYVWMSAIQLLTSDIYSYMLTRRFLIIHYLTQLFCSFFPFHTILSHRPSTIEESNLFVFLSKISHTFFLSLTFLLLILTTFLNYK